MHKDTLTIALNGDVHLGDFAKAIDCFRRLVQGLSDELAAGAKIQWHLASLETGSAVATVRGESRTGDVAAVVEGYEQTGEALRRSQPVPYAAAVRPASELLSLLNDRITSIRFETMTYDGEISSGQTGDARGDEFETHFGAVEGRIQSLSNRGGLRFTLYDELDDRAISCYVKPGSEESMRKAWGRWARVEGMVRRHVPTGRAIAVRQATIAVLPEGEVGDYRKAIGCAPAAADNLSPEEAVRKIRDA